MSFDVSYDNFAVHQCSVIVAKIMAFIVIKLKGKFDVDLVVDLQTRLERFSIECRKTKTKTNYLPVRLLS